MPSTKQLGFEILELKKAKHFGGAYLKKSHAKVARPITTKQSMHLVLRSSMAIKELSLLKKDAKVYAIIRRQAENCGVKIYRFANGGNHLHLVILPKTKEAFKRFIRAVTGLIARLILGTEKGSGKQIRFWDQRPFTRILTWGRDFTTVSKYLMKNVLEAYGFIRYTPRKSIRRKAKITDP